MLFSGTRLEDTLVLELGSPLSFQIKRSSIRKGMVMVSPRLNPQASWEFEAEILVLHHPTTISPRYQAMGRCPRSCQPRGSELAPSQKNSTIQDQCPQLQARQLSILFSQAIPIVHALSSTGCSVLQML